MFSDITPCITLKVNYRFGGTCRFLHQGRRISRARNQRETVVYFQRTTRRYIPEDRTLYNHRCENLNSCIICYVFLIPSKQTTCLILFILLDLITLIILGYQYKLRNSSLCGFLQPSVISSLVGPNILFSSLFSYTLIAFFRHDEGAMSVYIPFMSCASMSDCVHRRIRVRF
jgi:hypothetical protein